MAATEVAVERTTTAALPATTAAVELGVVDDGASSSSSSSLSTGATIGIALTVVCLCCSAALAIWLLAIGWCTRRRRERQQRMQQRSETSSGSSMRSGGGSGSRTRHRSRHGTTSAARRDTRASRSRAATYLAAVQATAATGADDERVGARRSPASGASRASLRHSVDATDKMWSMGTSSFASGASGSSAGAARRSPALSPSGSRGTSRSTSEVHLARAGSKLALAGGAARAIAEHVHDDDDTDTADVVVARVFRCTVCTNAYEKRADLDIHMRLRHASSLCLLAAVDVASRHRRHSRHSRSRGVARRLRTARHRWATRPSHSNDARTNCRTVGAVGW